VENAFGHSGLPGGPNTAIGNSSQSIAEKLWGPARPLNRRAPASPTFSTVLFIEPWQA
jgi:hypothetical protein